MSLGFTSFVAWKLSRVIDFQCKSTHLQVKLIPTNFPYYYRLFLVLLSKPCGFFQGGWDTGRPTAGPITSSLKCDPPSGVDRWTHPTSPCPWTHPRPRPGWPMCPLNVKVCVCVCVCVGCRCVICVYIYIYWVWPPHRMPVTTKIIIFLIGNPYKPSFTTVTVRGPHPIYIYIYRDLPRGAEWMMFGVPEKHHPLGFKQHPFLKMLVYLYM